MINSRDIPLLEETPTPPTSPTPPTPSSTLSSVSLDSLIGLRLGPGSLYLGFFQLCFLLSCILLFQSDYLHIIHHPCFRKLGSIGARCTLSGVLLADIGSFNFGNLTSCKGRFTLMSKSAK